MIVMKKIVYLLSWCIVTTSCQAQNTKKDSTSMSNSNNLNNPHYSKNNAKKVVVNDEEWRKILPADIYFVARQKGTERPWTSKFENFSDTGTYYCAVCGNALFKSDTKFDSGCGWPSFYEPITKGAIIFKPDNTHGMRRTETICGKCNSHLGHVFEDGPPPTGLRFCINGVVLDFEKAKEAEKNYNNKKPS